jgi:hypothetical protein
MNPSPKDWGLGEAFLEDSVGFGLGGAPAHLGLGVAFKGDSTTGTGGALRAT